MTNIKYCIFDKGIKLNDDSKLICSEGMIGLEELENILLNVEAEDWFDNLEVMSDNTSIVHKATILILLHKKIIIFYGSSVRFGLDTIQNLINTLRRQGWFIRQENPSIVEEHKYLKV